MLSKSQLQELSPDEVMLDWEAAYQGSFTELFALETNLSSSWAWASPSLGSVQALLVLALGLQN